MTAGPTIRATIWRMTAQPDDYAGGAILTGTAYYTNLEIRMQQQPEDQILLQQGLETFKTFTAVTMRGGLDIRERDELEITFPPIHPDINNRFRILGVRPSDFSDPRRYMLLSLQRVVRSHRQQ